MYECMRNEKYSECGFTDPWLIVIGRARLSSETGAPVMAPVKDATISLGVVRNSKAPLKRT
jgi:hypothetical protein